MKSSFFSLTLPIILLLVLIAAFNFFNPAPDTTLIVTSTNDGSVEQHLGDAEQTVAVLGQDVRSRGSQRVPGDYRYFANKVLGSGPYWSVAQIEAAP